MCLHCAIDKRVASAGYSALPDETESSNKIPKSSVGGRVKITNYENKNWSREMFSMDSVLNTNTLK